MATVSNYTAAESALARALYDDGRFYENFFRKNWPYAMASALTPELSGESQLPAREITSDVLADKLLARALQHGGVPRARIDSPMSEKTERRYTIVATRLAADFDIGYRSVYATDVTLKRASPAVFQWSLSLPDDLIDEQQQQRLALRLVEVYETGRSAVRKQDQQRSGDGTALERSPRYFELRSDAIEGALLRVDFEELPALSTEARRLFAVGVIVRALAYVSVLHVAVAAAAAWGYVRGNTAELNAVVSPANLQEALQRIENDVTPAEAGANRLDLFVSVRDDRRAETEIVRESERAVDAVRASLRSATIAERAVALTILNRIRTQSFAERRAVVAEAESVQSYIDAAYEALGMTGQKTLEAVRDRLDAYNDELANAASRKEYRTDLNDGAAAKYPVHEAINRLLVPVVNAAVALNAPRLPERVRPLYARARSILDDKVGPLAQRHASVILGVKRGDCYKDEKAIIRDELNEAVRDGVGADANSISMAFIAVLVELPTASMPLSTAVASDADIVPAVLALKRCLNPQTMLVQNQWRQILGAEAAAHAQPGDDDVAPDSYVARMRAALPVLYRRLSRAFLRTSELALLVNQRVSELLWSALRELLAAIAESSDAFASADRAADAMGVDEPNDPRLLSLPLVRSFYDLLGVSDNVFTGKPTPQQLQAESTPGEFARPLGLTREQTQLVLRQVASVQIRLRAGAQRSTRDGGGSTRDERLARAAVQATLAELEFWLSEQLRFYEAGGADFDLNVAELDKIAERSDARRRAFELDLNERRNEILRRAVVDSLEVAQKILRQYADSKVEGNPLVALEDVDQRTLNYLSQVIEDVKRLPLSDERYAVQVSEWLQLAQVFLQRSIINLMRSSRYENALATKFAFAYSLLFAAQRILSERRLVAESVGNEALVDASDEAGIRAVERALDADFKVLLIEQMKGRVDAMQVDDETKQQAEEALAALKRFRAGTEPIPLPSDAVAASILDPSYQQAVARAREYHSAYGASTMAGRIPQRSAEEIKAYQQQLLAVADGLGIDSFEQIANATIKEQYRLWHQQYEELVKNTDDARRDFTVNVATVAQQGRFLLETMQRASPIGAVRNIGDLRQSVARLRSLVQTLSDISAQVRDNESAQLPDYTIEFSADQVIRSARDAVLRQPTSWPPPSSGDVLMESLFIGQNGDASDYAQFLDRFARDLPSRWFTPDRVIAVEPNQLALAELRNKQTSATLNAQQSADLTLLIGVFDNQLRIAQNVQTVATLLQRLPEAQGSAERDIARELFRAAQEIDETRKALESAVQSRQVPPAWQANHRMISFLVAEYTKKAAQTVVHVNNVLSSAGLLDVAQTAGGETLEQLQRRVSQLTIELQRATTGLADALSKLRTAQQQLREARAVGSTAERLRKLAESEGFAFDQIAEWRRRLSSVDSATAANVRRLQDQATTAITRANELQATITSQRSSLQSRIDKLHTQNDQIERALQLLTTAEARRQILEDVAQKQIVDKYKKDLERVRRAAIAEVTRAVLNNTVAASDIEAKVAEVIERREAAIADNLQRYTDEFPDAAQKELDSRIEKVQKEQDALQTAIDNAGKAVDSTFVSLRRRVDAVTSTAQKVSEALLKIVDAKDLIRQTGGTRRQRDDDDDDDEDVDDKSGKQRRSSPPAAAPQRSEETEMREGGGRARTASERPNGDTDAPPAQRPRRVQPTGAAVPLDLNWGGAGISHL